MEWILSDKPIAYPDAIAAMERHVDAMIAGGAGERVWLLEHPPLYTGGTSAKPSDLLAANRFPVYQTGRGGEYTYHGPGQRVAYVMLDLKKRGAADVRAYVQSLERWLIATLAQFGVEGFTREGRVGVWVATANGEAKIAALGIRMRKWVTYHGVSLNVAPDLAHYAGIVPCGIQGYGVTSLEKLGIKASMKEVDAALKREFEKRYLVPGTT
jgi:lipoyl(octanoyl) transferase